MLTRFLRVQLGEVHHRPFLLEEYLHRCRGRGRCRRICHSTCGVWPWSRSSPAATTPRSWRDGAAHTALSRMPVIGRFLQRATPVPGEYVHALWTGEPFCRIGDRIRAIGYTDRRRLGMELADRPATSTAGSTPPLHCGSSANSRLDLEKGRVAYYYRSRFGGNLVEARRRRGCLCDHKIVHAAVLQCIVAQMLRRGWRN